MREWLKSEGRRGVCSQMFPRPSLRARVSVTHSLRGVDAPSGAPSPHRTAFRSRPCFASAHSDFGFQRRREYTAPGCHGASLAARTHDPWASGSGCGGAWRRASGGGDVVPCAGQGWRGCRGGIAPSVPCFIGPARFRRKRSTGGCAGKMPSEGRGMLVCREPDPACAAYGRLGAGGFPGVGRRPGRFERLRCGDPAAGGPRPCGALAPTAGSRRQAPLPALRRGTVLHPPAPPIRSNIHARDASHAAVTCLPHSAARTLSIDCRNPRRRHTRCW